MGAMKVIGSALYQWEIGRKIRVVSSIGNRAVVVQFAHPGDTEALSVTPREENGVIVVDIPNILLQREDKIVAFLVEVDAGCVETTRHSVFQVVKRPKPADYIYTETEVLTFEDLEARIKALEENSGAIKTVNGVSPDENGNVEVDALPDNAEQLEMLIEADLLPAVHDASGAILTDENGNIILRY